MAFLLSPLGLKLIMAIAIAAALAVLWHGVTEHYRDQGREEVRAEWAADTERRIAATTAITMLWDAKRQEAEHAADERDKERAGRLAERARAARALPPAVAGAHFPGLAVRVLNDAARDSAAPAEPARPTAPAAPTAADDSDATVGAVAEWGVALIGMYEVCRARVSEWQAFYAALQAAQPQEAPQ